MLKRVAFAVALISGCLMNWGCWGWGGDWYGLALDNVPRVITALLNEDIFG